MPHEVEVSTLTENSAFEMPWRAEGIQYGLLMRNGNASCTVRIPKHDASGWEVVQWSRGTKVLPAELMSYKTLRLGDPNSADRERSTIEKPVEVVHRLCDEMEGASRDEIVAACVAQGVNENTAKTQFYRWQKKQRRRG